jgi:hypothetical protein
MLPRPHCVILVIAVIGGGLFTQEANGQKQPPKGDAIRIIGGNSEIRRMFEVARDAVKKEDWQTAVQSLQAILNDKNNFYIKLAERDRDDPEREIVKWSSATIEANNLLGSLPPKGLEAYERAFGSEARKLLKDAGKKDDRLADVAQRFCHTKAGIEAHERIADLLLARGETFAASFRFETLLSIKHAQSQISDVTLFKAALAFRRSGDTKNFEQTWKKLTTNLESKKKGGLQVGDKFLSVEKLEEIIRKTEPDPKPSELHGWPMASCSKTQSCAERGRECGLGCTEMRS